MMIIGCDFHPSFQQIAYVEQETGEYEERRLSHRGEAEAFYRSLAGKAVRIGVEATGNDRWFHKLMSELGHELLARVYQPKTDRMLGSRSSRGCKSPQIV